MYTCSIIISNSKDSTRYIALQIVRNQAWDWEQDKHTLQHLDDAFNIFCQYFYGYRSDDGGIQTKNRSMLLIDTISIDDTQLSIPFWILRDNNDD